METTQIIQKCDDLQIRKNCRYYDVNVILKKDGKYDFVVGKEVGAGGFGTTYNAIDKTNPSKKYVLKVIDTSYMNQSFKKRFLTEFRNEIDIQNLASISGYTDEIELAYNMDDEYGFIMKKYKTTLYSFLKNIYEPFELKKNVLKQVKNAIIGISELGVLHGDLHLKNIMLDFNNKVKIIDFGESIIENPQKALKRNMEEFDISLEMNLITEPEEEISERMQKYMRKIVDYWESISQNIKQPIQLKFKSPKPKRSRKISRKISRKNPSKISRKISRKKSYKSIRKSFLMD